MVIARSPAKAKNNSPIKSLNLNVYDLLQNDSSKEPSVGSGTMSPPPSLVRKLKSSLKLSKSHSTPSVTTTSSSSSQKNVRFAAELTTVKKFDSSAEPISISNENSPRFYPISDSDLQYNIAHPETLYDGDGDDDDHDDDCCSTEDGFWFHESSILPSLQRLNDVKRLKKINKENTCPLSKFQLEYDSDSGVDYDEDEFEDDVPDIDSNCQKSNCGGEGGSGESDNNKFIEIIDWRLLKTNVCPFKKIWNPFLSNNNSLEDQIFDYLQGLNIRLHSLKQLDNKFGKIVGLIYVNNLNFEKFIEIKLTFNSWKDIHYITANYSRSVTGKIDEFKFVIDLNSLKYALQVKNLIYARTDSSSTVCPLNVELCCRYDVNNETFYDNNNYDNYQMKLTATTTTNFVPVVNEIPPSPVNDSKPQTGNSFSRDFLISTTLSHQPNLTKYAVDSRRFSDDTDYYNTSPLKHLYHNDTTLIRPVRLNQVLTNPEVSTDEEDFVETVELKAPMLVKDSNDSQNSSLSSTSSASFSSSSSGYSPLEDFAPLTNYEYHPYSSFDSVSSIEMANYNYHLPIFTNLSSFNETFDDGQSIVTDIVGDHTNKNNSTETLINPNAVPRPMSSSSAESATTPLKPHINTSNPLNLTPVGSNLPIMTSKPKDHDYQAFLSTYCFYNSPSSRDVPNPNQPSPTLTAFPSHTMNNGNTQLGTSPPVPPHADK